MYSRIVSFVCLVILFGLSSCRDRSSETEPGASKTSEASDNSSSNIEKVEEPSPNEEINKLQDDIESQQQSIEDLDAFVQMERAKLKENPDYDQSFMMEALEDQQKLRDSIKSSEARLKKLKERP